MLRLLLVRHGQSESNVAMQFTGQADAPLSELGRKQANELKEFILNNYNVDSIWSSDLLRARETVAPIAKALHLSIRKEKLLRENCLVIGDSLTSDIAGANAAGIRCVWYAPSGRMPEKAKPDYIARSYREILQIIDAINGSV